MRPQTLLKGEEVKGFGGVGGFGFRDRKIN